MLQRNVSLGVEACVLQARENNARATLSLLPLFSLFFSLSLSLYAVYFFSFTKWPYGDIRHNGVGAVRAKKLGLQSPRRDLKEPQGSQNWYEKVHYQVAKHTSGRWGHVPGAFGRRARLLKPPSASLLSSSRHHYALVLLTPTTTSSLRALCTRSMRSFAFERGVNAPCRKHRGCSIMVLNSNRIIFILSEYNYLLYLIVFHTST